MLEHRPALTKLTVGASAMAEEIPTTKRRKVQAGDRFGQLLAVRFERSEPGKTWWLFLCGQTMCLKDAAALAGLNYSTVCKRISALGWTPQQAIEEPVNENISRDWALHHRRKL